MLIPYYENDNGRLYCGDCREILPMLGHQETCITDPVWPNASVFDIPDPQLLMAEMCAALDVERDGCRWKE